MWPIIKKAVNSDLSTPLNTLINNVKSIVNTVNTNVGSNADAASATGSLHAKLAALPVTLNAYGCRASDALKVSADTPNDPPLNIDPTEWTKVKEIYVNFSGTIRVSWQVCGNSAHSITSYARVYVNDAPRGAIIGESRNSTYVSFTEDICVQKGNAVQLYMRKNKALVWGEVRNFRIYYDIVSNLDSHVVID
jgi:hypothetical protein